MKLNDYKEEIYKCSGCGQCQGVCPVYEALKKECAVSRGKFKLLNAILNNDAKYSKKVLEYMDLCLHCNKCSLFCPSGINAQKIIETAQFDMLKNGIKNQKKLFPARILANKKLMKFAKIFIDIIRNFKILEMINLFNCPNNKLSRYFLKIKVKPQAEKKPSAKTIKALYFKGCINNYVNPSNQNAIKNILQNTPAEIIEADFNCCGLPLKSAGDFECFKEIARENIKTALEKDFDYLIFDCASCKSTFLSYAEYIDGKEKEKAEELTPKIISIYELLDIINYKPALKCDKIAVHYPCHADIKEKSAIKKLLSDCNIVETEDTCCGAAGSFLFDNNKISKEISSKKAESIIRSDANCVVTTCPSCILGLKQGLIKQKSDIEVCQLIELLN
ncbi:MAG: (Fe-S)-binding protein [bacterium]|nr:(Fe-S)-binding protein [bacterium]